MFLSIQKSNLQEYPKLSQAYYVLLEYLAQDHISFIACLEPHVFLYILETISDGLTGQGSMPSKFTGQLSGLLLFFFFYTKQQQQQLNHFCPPPLVL